MPEYSSTTITPADGVQLPAQNGATSGNFQLSALRSYILASKGQANGLAGLGSDGKLDPSQVPGNLDDVLVYATRSNFPAAGTAGKIYIAADTNRPYRWDDALATPDYVELSVDLSAYATKVELAAEESAREAEDTNLKNALTPIKNIMASIADFGWTEGYIDGQGRIQSGSGRYYSDYLACPPNVTVKYIAETAHSNIMGISFYDSSKALISGVCNNGTNGTEQTVTSPTNTCYCRLSTKSEILDLTKYATTPKVLNYLNGLATANEEDIEQIEKGYLHFGTGGSIRGDVDSMTGLVYAKVVDTDYRISLNYLDSQGQGTSTAWGLEIDFTLYKTPTNLRIKRADEGVMPVNVTKAVVGIRMSGMATNGFVYSKNETAYVDGTYGSDSNNGLNRGTAFATIQKAIDEGFKHILVREGTYTSGIYLNRKQGITIEINKEYSAFDASTANTNPKVIIDCDSTLRSGVEIYRSSNIRLEDIEVANPTYSAFVCEMCEGISFINCIAHDVPSGNGFELINSNADFYNCGCYNIGTMGGGQHHDGFNLHGTGTQNFTNCWANYCEDDGISHHDACEGFVDGGEWHHCGKGGVCTPTHGAKVDVRNVYSHDCGYGIYCGNDDATLAKTFTITNSVCKNNTTYDIYVTNNTANIWNCIYDTIQHSGTGTNNILT